MEIVRGLDALPLDGGPAVVTVGFFDGVHLGHQVVLGTVVDGARERGARSVAITFDRHPREVLSPGNEPRLLMTVERKARAIAERGIDVLVVLEFDRDFSLMPADVFVRDVLAGGVHAVHAAMGSNFTFGFKALGTMEALPVIGSGEPVEGPSNGTTASNATGTPGPDPKPSYGPGEEPRPREGEPTASAHGELL